MIDNMKIEFQIAAPLDVVYVKMSKRNEENELWDPTMIEKISTVFHSYLKKEFNIFNFGDVEKSSYLDVVDFQPMYKLRFSCNLNKKDYILLKIKYLKNTYYTYKESDEKDSELRFKFFYRPITIEEENAQPTLISKKLLCRLQK